MKEKDLMKKIVEQNLADKERIRQRILTGGKQKVRREFSMKKIVAISLVAIMLALGIVTAMATIYYDPSDNEVQPMSVKGYSEVHKAIEKYNKKLNSFRAENLFGTFDRKIMSSLKTAPVPEGIGMDDSDSPNNGATEDYSNTNIQTEGMDEGDIVKNDGKYIYKINTKGFVIIDTNNGAMNLLYREDIENYVPQEMYVKGNQLIVIGGIYEQNQAYLNFPVQPLVDCISYMNYTKTDIRIYDFTNKEAPILERQITVDGNYFTSRLNEATNKLIYMINYRFYYGNENRYIPKIRDTADSAKTVDMPASDIYIYNDISNYEYLVIGEVLLSDAEAESKRVAFLGLCGEIYVSTENIFVATYDSYSVYEKNLFGWIKENNEYTTATRIVKIGLDTLEQKAATRIDGTVKNRYSLDEYEGYLRVATSIRKGIETYNNLYILKSDLSVAGKVERFAEGETIYSARFNGTRGIVVTFRQMDPYFIFDLSDPTKPIITGELKEEGVSYYLHYIEGTDYTIGIGLMSDSSKGRVIWTGLKVSLYDNSSGTAVNINTIEINGSCYAEVFTNPKALLYDKTRGLLAFAYENWQYDNDSYYNYSSVTQGLAVFHFDITETEDENKLTYRATLSNLDDEVDINEGRNNYYYNYLTFITRGIRIGDYIYTISDNYITSYDLENLEQSTQLNIYEEII